MKSVHSDDITSKEIQCLGQQSHTWNCYVVIKAAEYQTIWALVMTLNQLKS